MYWIGWLAGRLAVSEFGWEKGAWVVVFSTMLRDGKLFG